MTVRKIKNSWWVDFRAEHIRYRKRSPANSRAGAEAYEATLRHKLAQGGTVRTATAVAEAAQSFEVFANSWFETYVVPNNKLSEQWSKWYILKASLLPFFGRMPIDQISMHDIERFKSHAARLGLTNKTINNRLTVLKKCLGSAYDWLGLDGRPPAITWLKCIPPKTDFLTEDEAVRLLASAEGVVYELILTALRTGMRQGELRGLQWSSIDWQSRLITVRHSKSDYSDELGSPKSNRERHIPMHDDVFETLWRRRAEAGYVFQDENDKPFNSARMKLRLMKTCTKAGLRQIGWHKLRHTFASHLAVRGVPLGAVQTLLGHSNITTTMRYAHLAPSALRAAVDILTAERSGQPAGNQGHTHQKNVMPAG